MASHFISYSRQELTFVDSLWRHLEKLGHDTWLDFRRLVPGRPWQDQLYNAIENAAVILLIVSRESMTSPAVYDEWTTALRSGKRIILILFETADLKATDTLRNRCSDAMAQGWATENIAALSRDGCVYGWDELKQCEWIDFRGPFSKAAQQLDETLKSAPHKPGAPIPQGDFRMPPTPTVARYLSWITALMSIPTVIPAIRLVPFTQKIVERTYRYNIISLHLVGLIVLWIFAGMLLFSLVEIPDSVENLITFIWLGLTLAPVALLGLMMYAPGMYRWAGPGGAPVPAMIRQAPLILRPSTAAIVIMFAIILPYLMLVAWASFQPYVCIGIIFTYWLLRRVMLRGWLHSIARPEPVRFSVEYHPLYDGAIASEIIDKLKQSGHRYIPSIQDDSDCTLIVLSNYKTTTQLSLQELNRAVYPVLIDDVDTTRLVQDLSQLQWLDLRRGAPMKIGLLARIIHDARLLNEYLAVPPTRHIRRAWIVDVTLTMLVLIIASQVVAILGIVLNVLSILNDPRYRVNWGAVVIPLLIPIIIIWVCYPLIDRVRHRDITYRAFIRTAVPIVFFGYFAVSRSLLAGGLAGLWVIMFIIGLLNGKALRLWLVSARLEDPAAFYNI